MIIDAAPDQVKELSPLEWTRMHASNPSSGASEALRILNETKSGSIEKPAQSGPGFHKGLLGTLRSIVRTNSKSSSTGNDETSHNQIQISLK